LNKEKSGVLEAEKVDQAVAVVHLLLAFLLPMATYGYIAFF